MLKVDKIDTNYGAVAMLRDVSFDVAEGEVVGPFGPAQVFTELVNGRNAGEAGTGGVDGIDIA